ncbi:MAG TPA: VOC family protein [Acetobacteraceae bacterium]|jgi:catechol 2,3-dioxygenase-like lactoylglutathione lyase family enzyme|nr:VOC family protein [Acetobacteraceae bacterium]
MPALALNHYTINVRDLEATKAFYEDIVGLKSGERPPLPFPGYWLYCGGQPVVHLVGHRPENPPIEGTPDSGRLDHIAFSAENVRLMRERLNANGISFQERVLPQLNMTQLFFQDPDGIYIEFNFPAEETV